LVVVGALGLGVSGLVIANHDWTQGIASRVQKFTDGSGRSELWSAAWSMFRERPLTGSGPDTFHHVFGRHDGGAYWSQSWGVTPTRAHNEFLHVLATQGIFGALAGIAIAIALCFSFVRAWRVQPRQRGLIVCVATALAGFFITEMFSYTVIACGSLIVVLAAFASRLGQEETPHPALPPKRGEGKPNFSPRFGGRAGWGVVLQAAPLAGCAFLLLQLVIDPLRADLLSAEAELLTATQPEQALKLHEEAVRICPREPRYWNRMAGCAEDLALESIDVETRCRLLERALHGYTEAATRESANGHHHNNRGRVLGELARMGRARADEAFAAFDTALRLDPVNAYFYADASQAALALGAPDRAEGWIDAGLRRYTDWGQLRKQEGMLLLLRDRPREALSVLQIAVSANWHDDNSGLQAALKVREEVQRRLAIIEKARLSQIGTEPRR
jgi:tetratricopeptide (TPR) repeat protein